MNEPMGLLGLPNAGSSRATSRLRDDRGNRAGQPATVKLIAQVLG